MSAKSLYITLYAWVLSLLISAPLYAQTLKWQKTFGGNSWDGARAVIQLSDGGYAVAGFTESYGKGKKDAWILRLDTKGNKKWEKTYGGRLDEELFAVVEIEEGLVLAGYTESKGRGDRDMWLIKTNHEGDLLLDETIGGSDRDEAHALITFPNGDFGIAGFKRSKRSSVFNAWIARTDGYFNESWSTSFGTRNESAAFDLALLPDNQLAIAGYTSKGMNISANLLILNAESGSLYNEYTFQGKGTSEVQSLAWSPDGNILIGGYTDGEGAGGSDAWIAKVNRQGQIQWKKTFGGKYDDELYELQVDEAGNMVVVGFQERKGRKRSMWSAQLNPSGKLLWEDHFFTQAASVAESIFPTDYGRYVIAGFSESNMGNKEDLALVCVDLSLQTPGQALPNTQGSAPTNTGASSPLRWLSPSPEEISLGASIRVEKPQLDIRLKASQAGYKRHHFKLLLNGESYAEGAKFDEISLSGSTFKQKVVLQQGLNTLKAGLETTEGIKWAEEVQILFEPVRPKVHVLAIGTSPGNLNYTVKDARDFASLYIGQKDPFHELFADVKVQSLLGDQATAANILKTIESYKQKSEIGELHPRDIFILYMSSHGFIYRQEFRIQGDDFMAGLETSTSVAYNQLMEILNGIECKKLLFIDACHSGGAQTEAEELNHAMKRFHSRIAGLTTITSSSQEEYSWEDEEWENGAFTESILNGLADKTADENQDNLITIQELYRHLALQVPEMVKLKKKGAKQNPRMIKNELDDIPIFSLR